MNQHQLAAGRYVVLCQGLAVVKKHASVNMSTRCKQHVRLLQGLWQPRIHCKYLSQNDVGIRLASQTDTARLLAARWRRSS